MCNIVYAFIFATLPSILMNDMAIAQQSVLHILPAIRDHLQSLPELSISVGLYAWHFFRIRNCDDSCWIAWQHSDSYQNVHNAHTLNSTQLKATKWNGNVFFFFFWIHTRWAHIQRTQSEYVWERETQHNDKAAYIILTWFMGHCFFVDITFST